jgi:hypothetical protein
MYTFISLSVKRMEKLHLISIKTGKDRMFTIEKIIETAWKWHKDKKY